MFSETRVILLAEQTAGNKGKTLGALSEVLIPGTKYSCAVMLDPPVWYCTVDFSTIPRPPLTN